MQCAGLFQSNRHGSWGAPGSGWPRLLISCRDAFLDDAERRLRFLARDSQSLHLVKIGLFKERLDDYAARGLCGSSAPSLGHPRRANAADPISAGLITYAGEFGVERQRARSRCSRRPHSTRHASHQSAARRRSRRSWPSPLSSFFSAR